MIYRYKFLYKPAKYFYCVVYMPYIYHSKKL